MRYLLLIITLLTSIRGFSTCNISNDIEKVSEGYLYTKDCHIYVGEQVFDNIMKEKEIKEYKQLLDLKSDEIKILDKEVGIWKSTVYRNKEDYEKSLDNEKYMRYFYFAAGVLTPLLINKAMEN